MTSSYLTSASFLLLCVTMSTTLPVERNRRADELTSQLGRLKTLLHKLEERKLAGAKTEYQNVDMGPPPLLKTVQSAADDDSTENDDEPPADKGRPVTSEDTILTPEADDNSDDTLQQFVGSLSTDDMAELKILKKMIDEARAEVAEKRSEETVNIQDSSDAKVETETEEGTFGPFRDEIKLSVEKNLLADVALAMHNGISVDEILADLTQPAQADDNAVWSNTAED